MDSCEVEKKKVKETKERSSSKEAAAKPKPLALKTKTGIKLVGGEPSVKPTPDPAKSTVLNHDVHVYIPRNVGSVVIHEY